MKEAADDLAQQLQQGIFRLLMNGMAELLQSFGHAEMTMQFVRGSLLAKDKLHRHFHRADACHERSSRRFGSTVATGHLPAAYEWHG